MPLLLRHAAKLFPRCIGDESCNEFGSDYRFLVFVYTLDGTNDMKRIVAILVCGILLAVSSTAEARWFRRNNGGSYNQPMQYAPAATTAQRTTAYKPVTQATPTAESTLKD